MVRPFDLDDIRAEVGQILRQKRTCKDAAHIENAQMIQSFSHSELIEGVCVRDDVYQNETLRYRPVNRGLRFSWNAFTAS